MSNNNTHTNERTRKDKGSCKIKKAIANESVEMGKFAGKEKQKKNTIDMRQFLHINL